jgi:hypothetical protein
VINVSVRTDGGQTKGQNEKFCADCGEIIKQKAEICPECGVRQTSGYPTDEGPDRTTTAIFALLLGGLGAHHFYLGNTLRGVLYLLFVWTLIPAIVSLVEGILYLTKSDEEFHNKYVKPD